MNYLQLLKQARTHGVTSEKKMWDSIAALSNDLLLLKETNPDIYWHIMRNQHAVLYDRHYTEQYANHDVNAIIWSKQPDGVPTPASGAGAHWSKSEVVAATKGLKFHPKVNDWDKYVAFNAMYADLCAEMTDEDILKAAYLFYFQDKDWQNDDDCTKIWDYMTAHTTI